MSRPHPIQRRRISSLRSITLRHLVTVSAGAYLAVATIPELVEMLDPVDYDDVMITVAHPWGDIEAPLPTWIQNGPGPGPLVTIRNARRSDGADVPLEEIPLEYRNTTESCRLPRLGLLPSPRGPPANEPPTAGRLVDHVPGSRPRPEGSGRLAVVEPEERQVAGETSTAITPRSCLAGHSGDGLPAVLWLRI